MRAADIDEAPLRWVISGGIGSGKSTVVRILGELGATVVEADRIGHAVLEPEGAAFDTVSTRWPEVVVGGRVDRARLAAIVFSDPDQLDELEAMTHPAIAAEIAARVAAAAGNDLVLELPLLSEMAGPGWTRVIVDAPTEVRSSRAAARGFDDRDVARRLAAQPEREEWLAAADIVIDNTGTLDELRSVVEDLWREHKRLSGRP